MSPELGDVSIITFLLNKAYFPLSAAWWNSSLLSQSNYNPSLTLTTDAQITRQHNQFPAYLSESVAGHSRAGSIAKSNSTVQQLLQETGQAAAVPQPPSPVSSEDQEPSSDVWLQLSWFLRQAHLFEAGVWEAAVTEGWGILLFCGADVSDVANQIGGQLPQH